jgi:hypothetical protein
MIDLNKLQGFTPGPWKHGSECDGWEIVTNNRGNIIANVNAESGPDAASVPAMRVMPATGNAALIAAAPEFLELAKLGLELAEYVAAHPGDRIMRDMAVALREKAKS